MVNMELDDTALERIRYYLGPISDPDMCISKNSLPTHQKDMPKKHWFDTVERIISDVNNKEQVNIQGTPINHIRDLCLRCNIKEGNLYYSVRDEFTRTDFPVLAMYANGTTRLKQGKLQTETNTTCIKFLFDRWWKWHYESTFNDKFADKQNKCVWRGNTTSHWTRPGNRFDLVKRWYKKRDDIDVGFSKIAMEREHLVEELQGSLCECIYPKDWAAYKYILSAPGNMNESGISWKLGSNSVVIMPKPTIFTWLCEHKLKPGVHYVQVRDDWEDLGEVVDWCNDNQSHCEEIVHNAREFMLEFKDHSRERAIEEEVFSQYIKYINS